MADVADQAADYQEKMIAEAIKLRKQQPIGTGFCNNCFEPIDVGRFCDCDCRDDFEKRNRV